MSLARKAYKENEDNELLNAYLVTLILQLIYIGKHHVECSVHNTDMRNELVVFLVEILDKYEGRLPSLTSHLHDGPW